MVQVQRFQLRHGRERFGGYGDPTATEPAANIAVRLDPYAIRDTDVSEVVALDDLTFTAQVAL